MVVQLSRAEPKQCRSGYPNLPLTEMYFSKAPLSHHAIAP
jgi:hypothetical protein